MRKDRFLIRRLQRGDQAALRRIYKEHKDRMLTIANNLLLDFSAAEDCLHDVFVDFAAGAGDFRLQSNLSGYLMTCMANRARDLLRAKSRHNVSISTVQQHPVDHNSPADRFADHEEAAGLCTALAELPYEQREIIVLHLNGNLKFRQIAKQQGLSINTVQSRYRYGLDKLRSLLERGAET